MKASDWIALCSAVFSGVAVMVAVIAAVIASRQRRDGQRAAEAAERSADSRPAANAHGSSSRQSRVCWIYMSTSCFAPS